LDENENLKSKIKGWLASPFMEKKRKKIRCSSLFLKEEVNLKSLHPKSLHRATKNRVWGVGEKQYHTQGWYKQIS
jgi:hypothetical protein